MALIQCDCSHTRYIIGGLGSVQSYRSIWHTGKGNKRPSTCCVREIDPEGTELRRAHRLNRRITTIWFPTVHGIVMGMIN